MEIDFDSDVPGRLKWVVVKVGYPVDCGDALTQLFELLYQRGIKSEIIASGEDVDKLIVKKEK